MAANLSLDACKVLAIHAHPDDVEFQCAGTLKLLKDLGVHITIVTMTPGDCGSKTLAPDEIAIVRRQEAADAAKLIDAHYECLEFRDLSIVIDLDSKRRVTECIRRHRPHIVFNAPPIDYMDDHEATSQLVRDACFSASCPNYKTQAWDPAPATDDIPILFYVDPVEGCDRFGEPIRPHFYINVSSVFSVKREMLACHQSQREWLRAQHGVDEYLDSQERWARHRGGEMNCQYAEAFRQHLGHPYPQHNPLAEWLSDLFYMREE